MVEFSDEDATKIEEALILSRHATNTARDEVTKLRQALAEKDKEIAKWRRIRTPTHGNCCTCQKCGLDHDSCRCDIDDVCDELDQLKLAYQQLLAQAVRFAKQCEKPVRGKPAIKIAEEAEAFLKEREGT